MKKIILTLALLMGVCAAQAQSLEQNKFFDNMSVTLKGGAIMPYQGYAFWPSARGIFGLEIKKQLTPVFGLGVEGEATINTTSWGKPDMYWGPKSPNIIDHTLAGMFGTVNLSNLFGGYKGIPRFFELEGVIGAGWLHAFHRTEAANMYGNDYNSWYTKAGANLNFNFGESRAWTFSLKPAVVWDMNGDIMIPYRDNTNARARWNGEPRNGKSQMNATTISSLTTYRLGNMNRKRAFRHWQMPWTWEILQTLHAFTTSIMAIMKPLPSISAVQPTKTSKSRRPCGSVIRRQVIFWIPMEHAVIRL